MYKSGISKQNCLLFIAKQFVFHLSVISLIVLLGFQIGLAKPKSKFEKLRTDFAIGEEIKDIDGVKIRKKLKRLLSNPLVRQFLATIKEAEAGEPDLMVGGCRAKNLKKHPAEALPKSCRFPIYINGVKKYAGSSGNYQLTLENWKAIAPFLGLKDFSEENQAIAALELIRRGGGAADAYTKKGLVIKNRIQNGFLALVQENLKKAFRLATYDWASSKDSPLPVPPGYQRIDYWKLSKKID
jgi:muramidase (phage lysozyme)